MEAVEGGRPTTVDGGKGGWLWMVIGVFWSFYNVKYSLPIGMLDFHRGR